MSDFSQKLDLRQSQNLVMTPQLQQAIKILQMNNLELETFIESEIAQNPLLEKDETGASSDEEKADDIPAPEASDSMETDFSEAWTGNGREGDSSPTDFDAGSSMASIGAGGSRSFDIMDEDFESRMSRDETLREHLTAQMHVAFSDTRDRLIGAMLIDRLDESGYLREGAGDLAQRLGCSADRLERILKKMRGFDPTGVFAVSLQDCLAMQLEEQGRLDSSMETLLGNLGLLAAHDYEGLLKKCGVNETYLHDMIAEVRALNPRPAADFEHLVVQTAIPDVLMKRLPKNLGGGWRVELNADTLPKVLVNQAYYTEVAQAARAKQDKKYLDEQLQNASWLVRAMDQRAKTILKVAGEIIEEQEAFFLYGIEFLRPLTLKDIAQRIDMHESTVSRVTSNKYIGTPRGIFELKYFFSSALGEGDGAHSSEAVKARIRTMIDAEEPDRILSDDGIAEILTKDGIEIARRTVAKYREALHIPSSVQRRKIKQKALAGRQARG